MASSKRTKQWVLQAEECVFLIGRHVDCVIVVDEFSLF
jgi:hypothetical protein